VALVRRLGADKVVDGRRDDIAAAAREFAPKGMDAIFATAGGDALSQCLDALRRGGRVAYPNGVEPAPRKRQGMKIVSYDAAVGLREFNRLNRAVEEAELKVPIAAEFPLAAAAEAHRRIQAGHVLGKFILRIH
jgi:NADPH:quinone reductase-like Zn-dependent oxidoreductase